MTQDNCYEIEDLIFQLQQNHILIELIQQQFRLFGTSEISAIQCIERADYLTEIYLEQATPSLKLLAKSFYRKTTFAERK